MSTYRENTKKINIGGRIIGGGEPIAIQSMTNTKTEDIKATVEQIRRLRDHTLYGSYNRGCSCHKGDKKADSHSSCSGYSFRL